MTDLLHGERAQWRLEERLPPEFRDSLNGFSPMLCHVLYCRGYRTPEAIETFFTQSHVSHDPFLLPDVKEAVSRIADAATREEKVAVYGDFDCDGLTSAAVLVATLSAMGLDPIAHIPTREHGHGLHPEALARLSDEGVRLVITADCGVTAVEEVRVARGMGMDVIVTDHHEARPDGLLPDCLVVSATRHDSSYPFRFLCGVGVAYKLAQALAQTGHISLDPDDLLDLVALGTVADVVPLLDENRSLVIRGLRRLQGTTRPGLLALFRAAGVERDRIDPVSVAFYLAPRINAANRMASPQLAYDLITASNSREAEGLADQLSAYNQQRQLLVAQHFEEIVQEIGPPPMVREEVETGRRPPLLIVIGEWAAGINGLLASKLVDAYGLPAFVGTEGRDGVVSVSARSIEGVHIDEMLEGAELALPGGIFLGHGGHAGAAGFRVETDRFPVAREMLEQEAVRHVRIDEIGAMLAIDAEVSLDQLTLHAARQIRSLAPFGPGFVEPLFLARGVRMRRRSTTGDGKHLRFSVQRGAAQSDGISFNASPALVQLPLESRLDIVFHLQINERRGLAKPELRLRDWRLAA